ncbi:MAG: 6-phosphofructokinase [Clostridiales bacterium]|jgi:6-phosphofructokinase 1|nr:6-phosphofructokinase [Clostridiales bacterium]
MKRIAVMTSGGDAPGMNATVRAVVRSGIDKGMEVLGVIKGYAGLIENNFTELSLRSVSDIIHRGGTILRTARCPEFKTEKGQKTAIKNLAAAGIEGIVVIGGDGSFMGAKVLSERGVPTIGIPGTIDNDIAYTDFTLGFDTACNTILDAINKIRDTMSSHERISIVEVMGRNCGDLALWSGIGGGAEIIIVPEAPLSDAQIVKKLTQFKKSGKYSGIIVMAEGAGHADELMERLTKRTGFHIRSTVLGHIQRGGSPSMQDRYLGTSFGAYAVDLLYRGIGNRIIGIKNNKIFDTDITEGLKQVKKFNKKLYKLAETVAK